MRSSAIARLTGLVAAMALALGAAAGCGKITTPSPSSSGTASPSAINPASSGSTGGAGTTAAATLKTASTSLGTILVNAGGMTLYRYTADTKDKSNCTWGGCTTLWPPLTAQGTPKAGTGVTGTLSTLKGPTGQTQVAYGGWPLYTYAGDAKPGQTTGQGVKDSHGTWYVVYATSSKNPTPGA